ncbi:MAG: MBL fold metallo-hydrolase [Bacteroidetes bacterium]|nr:MBL fold metallo-hydrolase [Bacteroidota bacterium]
MQFQSFGGVQEVTGSMHIISVNGKKILLDCGLFQGRRAESIQRNSTIPFDPSTIHAVVLSHAHIDHSGNLPNLVSHGYRGPIFSTHATRDLCNVMLYDSAYLQERDIEYVNKKRARRNEPPISTPYDVVDVTESLQHFIGVNYHYEIAVASGIQARFYDAGHILGSAISLLEIEENGKTIRIGFSGDLGRKNMPILKNPEYLNAVDFLIMESTYGGKVHEPADNMKESLYTVIKRTVDRNGKVIIPSFSVGRTQEVIYLLHELFNEGRLPAIPIYVDSPLAVNATEVFRMHPECFDADTLKLLHANGDPFGFHRVIYVHSVEQSKSLNDLKQSCIIISASGMCEGGRIVHHLANNVGNPNNTILIVGFQAENTLGRRLVDKVPEISIFGDVYKVNAEIEVLNSFSAHAGQDEILEYISALDLSKLKKILLVHGEINQSIALQKELATRLTIPILIPQKGEVIDL